MTRVGLISDTHGLLRPEATAFLRGCDVILHAGDVGGAEVLAQLSALAPVTAVRGNNDRGAWADRLAERERLRIDGVTICLVHDLAELDDEAAGCRVVVAGHSHKPAVQERDGVLYVNPGSAGPRRFKLPIAAGELRLEAGIVQVRLMDLGRGHALWPAPVK